MSTPFDKAATSIPVTVVTKVEALAQIGKGDALIRLEPALHQHDTGSECVACAARGDIRALLFDLLQRSRQPGENPLRAVIVDASALTDPGDVISRIDRGAVPAFGLRDHTVARSFHLSRVL